MPVPAGRKAEQLGDPVADEQLELGRRGRRPPEEPDRVQRRGEQLREDPRLGGRGREVGKEARMLPVRDPRHEDLVEVAQHRLERLPLVGRGLWEAGKDVAGPDLCQHRQVADTLEVVGRPVDGGMAVVPETHPRNRPFQTCPRDSPSNVAR